MSEAPGYQRFFAELKRRKVFRVAAVYGATGFVVLQVADLLAEGMELPSVVLKTTTFLVLLGFPIAMVLAWALELTPDGVKRTDPAQTGELEAIVAEPAGKRWPAGVLALLGIAALVAGAWWVGRSTAPGTEGAAPASASGTAGPDRGAEVLQLAYADLESDQRPSIAVLPFADMSQAGDQEYFADGMTEELLNALAKIREIRVGGRTSSFAYKGQDKDLREIGEELGVQYVVEGSVRKQGDRLRITAQLVDATDNFHLWSESYDRTIDDVFAVQEEIAGAIAEELQVSLGLDEQGALVAPTADLDAYELYLTGRARMRERGEGVPEAVDLFEATVARDSSWAPGWAGLAQAHSLFPYYGDFENDEEEEASWPASLSAAERAANRALAIDPRNAAAEVALGNVYRDRWEWETGERHYVRALEIDPDDVEAHQQYAELLAATGRLDEALRSARRAVALDPTSAIRLNVLGYILEANSRPEEGMLQLELALAHGGDFPAIFNNIVRIHLRGGDLDRADSVMREEYWPRFVEPDRDPEERAEAYRFLDEMMAAYRNRDVAAFEACCSRFAGGFWNPYLIMGDTATARQKAYERFLDRPRYNGNLPMVLWDRLWDDRRDDPRYIEMSRHANLAEAEVRRAAPGS
ncbi:MAG: tetratricopeptide repeat protein [marine benthic group bacterium]|nr:tetratricopeptide repeat protein [Candidatus Carthagonibacter metallireducens]